MKVEIVEPIQKENNIGQVIVFVKLTRQNARLEKMKKWGWLLFCYKEKWENLFWSYLASRSEAGKVVAGDSFQKVLNTQTVALKLCKKNTW